MSILDYIKQNSILFLDFKSLADGTVSTWPSLSTNYSYSALLNTATAPTKSSSGVYFNGSQVLKVTSLNLTILSQYTVFVVHKLIAPTGTIRSVIDHQYFGGAANGWLIYCPSTASQYFIEQNKAPAAGYYGDSTLFTPLIGTNVVTEFNIKAPEVLADMKVNGISPVGIFGSGNWAQPSANHFFIGGRNGNVLPFLGEILAVIILPLQTDTIKASLSTYLKTYYGIA